MGNIIAQIFGIIKKLIIIGIIAGIPLFIISKASDDFFNLIINRVLIIVDSTPLYTISKNAYLDNVISGQRNRNIYLITKETAFYSSILIKEKLEETEALGTLYPNTIVELQNVIRRGEHVWVPAFFYIGEKPQNAYALFPRDWEENVTAVDREEIIAAINNQYEKFVKNNFELMEVEPENEKEYKEKYNDYYMIRGISGENHFYAPRTDRAKIDKTYSYYLSANNIRMVMLQADKEWVRPALVLEAPAETQTEEE